MVVRIRFSMHGPRHNKLFHIVAINSKKRRDAKPIETLGVFRHTIDPAKDRATKSVEWSVARIKYWLGVGAQPSKSAVRLFTQVRSVPQPADKERLKRGTFCRAGFYHRIQNTIRKDGRSRRKNRLRHSPRNNRGQAHRLHDGKESRRMGRLGEAVEHLEWPATFYFVLLHFAF